MSRFHHSNIYNPYTQKIICALCRRVRFREYKEPQKRQPIASTKTVYGPRSRNISISGKKKLKKLSATNVT